MNHYRESITYSYAQPRRSSLRIGEMPGRRRGTYIVRMPRDADTALPGSVPIVDGNNVVPMVVQAARAVPGAVYDDPINHIIYHDGSWSHDVLALPCVVGSATDADAFTWPDLAHVTSFDGLLNDFLVKHKLVKAKGHRGICQGATKDGGRRLAANMRALHFVSVDIDNGTMMADTVRVVDALSHATVIHSTASHRKNKTVLKNAELTKHFGKKVAELTEPEIKSYLVEEKGYLPWVVETIKVESTPGFTQTVTHAPTDRFRVVIPLSEPWVIESNGETLPEVAQKWAAFYRGVAKLLGVRHDKSCEDLSRFMWLPEHLDGAEFVIHVFGGPDRRALRFEEIAPVDKVPGQTSGSAKVKKGNNRKTYEVKRLKQFHKASGGRYLIEELMEHAGCSLSRGGDGWLHGECPRADLHTDPDNPENRLGFSCTNEAGDECRAYAKCWHDHCKGEDISTLSFVEAACMAMGIEDAGQLEEYATPLLLEGMTFQMEPDDWSMADTEAELIKGFHEFGGSVASSSGSKFVKFGSREEGTRHEFWSKEAFMDLFAHAGVLGGTDKKPKWIAFLPSWMRMKEARSNKFHGLVFAPNKSQEDVSPYLNMWQGLAVVPSEEAFQKGDCDLILAHARELCGGKKRALTDPEGVESDAMKLLGVLAHHLRTFGDLEQKAPLTPVQMGAEGTGKTEFYECYGSLYGVNSHTLTNIEDMTGFNAQEAESLFTIIDEGFCGPDPRIRGALKHLLSGRTLRLERKGIDAVDSPNHAVKVIISNETLPVHLDMGSRRFLPLHASDEHRNDSAYFKPLRAQMRGDAGRSAFGWYLMREYEPPAGVDGVPSWAFLWEKNDTAAGAEMLAENLTPAELYLIRQVYEAKPGKPGVLLPQHTFPSCFAVSTDTPGEWDIGRILADYKESLEYLEPGKYQRQMAQMDTLKLGKLISTMFPSVKTRPSNGKRLRLFDVQKVLLRDLKQNQHHGYRARLGRLEEADRLSEGLNEDLGEE